MLPDFTGQVKIILSSYRFPFWFSLNTNIIQIEIVLTTMINFKFHNSGHIFRVNIKKIGDRFNKYTYLKTKVSPMLVKLVFVFACLHKKYGQN